MGRILWEWRVFLIIGGMFFYWGEVEGFQSKGGGGEQLVRQPRMSYMAKIVEEKEKRITEAPARATTDPSDYDDEDEEDGGNSAGSSSNSEDKTNAAEENEEVNILGIPRKTTKGEAPSPSSDKQVDDKGRRVVGERSAQGHNWYVYNDKRDIKGRTFGNANAPGIPPGGSPASPPSPATGGSPSGSSGKAGAPGGSPAPGGTPAPGGGSTGPATGPGGSPAAPGGTGGAPGNSGGSGGGGATKTTRIKPYNVQRANANHKVDPSGFNFFQFNPKDKSGWLYYSKGSSDKLSGRKGFRRPSKDDGGADVDDADEANLFDWEFRRYDRACLYLEYKNKRSTSKIPLVPEEIKRLVDIQNEKLGRKFISWQFVNQPTPEEIALGEKGKDHPQYLGYKFLEGVVSIFSSKICKNASSYREAAAASAPFGVAQKALLGADGGGVAGSGGAKDDSVDVDFLPTRFLENILSLFLTLRNMTTSESAKDYATPEDDEVIFEKMLKACNETEDSIPWFYHSCGDQLLSSDQYNNYACTPFSEYDFNPKSFDPVLDAVWHMFNAVHSYCFTHFLTNPRMWHKFSLIMANIFTPEMRLRWTASVANDKFYMRLLGPESLAYLETINRCTFAAALRSDAPVLLPRFNTQSITTYGMIEN